MQKNDIRNIKYGFEIPKEGYCDQPYIVIAKDGSWVCALTTSKGVEGDRDQHIISARSLDKGETWHDVMDIEPSGPPEASWVTPLVVPSGRIYVFYTYNGDNLTKVITDKGYEYEENRIDTLGQMMFKYSDDNGKTWSKKRYQVPMRNFEIDYKNPYGGEIQFFWSVGKPYAHNDGSVYIGCAKVGSFGKGFMASSEGIVIKSSNILTENDPEKIQWETTPDGEVGLRAVRGTVADEHNVTGLADGSLYCLYRTVAGHNCHSYSRDGGKTWSGPQHATYTPNGRELKHNRAANFVRKYSNGKFTLWFNNHGRDWTNTKTSLETQDAYNDRNPVWMCGGIEKDGYIYWSQPEIILYDDDPITRISYPDFIEDNGEFYISETQKTVARTHKIDKSILDGMWSSFDNKKLTTDGLIVSTSENTVLATELFLGNGLTFDFWIDCCNFMCGKTILDTRGVDGKGIIIETYLNMTLKITLTSRRAQYSWISDKNILNSGMHHVAIVLDDGPKIITFIVDGQVLDGGDERQYGFGRYFCPLNDFASDNNSASIDLLNGNIKVFRIYNRYLRTYEITGNFQCKEV